MELEAEAKKYSTASTSLFKRKLIKAAYKKKKYLTLSFQLLEN